MKSPSGWNSLGGNSEETLLGGVESGGKLYFFIFTSNSLSLVVVLEKVALSRKNIFSFLYPSPKESGDFVLRPF